MSDVRSRRRVLSLCPLWRACVWVVVLARVPLGDEPPAPQPAVPPFQSVADDPLAEAKRLSDEVVRLHERGRYREPKPKARQAVTATCLSNLASLFQAQ